ncbi:hypothetical protein SAMN05444392_12116 [Seinonella peptonophila]|uniref:Uncharacterized protein n=1 Tax=Seinonella peptonophila TaxID=112248 RepID=A0A1M5BCV6_9BACL|nr:hypothetical protein [Seinonella peptonophila]SHF40255.1 hypothetical protein SAMN05444392_12116 [Seinonella peptonophila]
MSQLTPEQFEMLQKAVEETVKQQIASGQFTTDQMPDVTKIIGPLPTIISSLVTTPINSVSSSFLGLLNGLVGVLGGLVGATGISNDIASNLVNIIKKEIPTSQIK